MATPRNDRPDDRRNRLIAQIANEARETANWTGRATFADAVMAAMARVPREAFVAEGDEGAAYINRPQPIGYGQTISQPYIVALMTDLLDVEPGDRVLEIGTGSGYQAAVLAEMGAEVWSVETVGPLARRAEQNLAKAGYETVHVRTGDGFAGWPEHAPYDGVIVTAAPERMPESLTKQLKPGGRMVIPVGAHLGPQMLHRGVMGADGTFTSTGLLPVAFVPMVQNRITP